MFEDNLWKFRYQKFTLIMPLWIHDQGKDYWDDSVLPSVKCSFGAAVARAFHHGGREIPYRYREEDGRHTLAEYLYLRKHDLDTLLWLCGASPDPFYATRWPWELPAEKVLANLAGIERRPTDAEFRALFWHLWNSGRLSIPVLEIWNQITDSAEHLC